LLGTSKRANRVPFAAFAIAEPAGSIRDILAEMAKWRATARHARAKKIGALYSAQLLRNADGDSPLDH
jgi:hypothetical protein